MAKQDSKGTKTPISIYLLPREGPLILALVLLTGTTQYFHIICL